MAGMSMQEFADRIDEIMPVIMREFARHAGELYKGKITMQQFLILSYLYRKDEATMGSLAAFMDVSTAAMTQIIDRLVKVGYVLRVNDPADRRIVKASLTTKGLELVKRMNEQRRRKMIEIFGEVSEMDRSNYLRILSRIKEILLEKDPGLKNG